MCIGLVRLPNLCTYINQCRAEILQKEDDDLLIFEIREEILEEAMSICYERYMEKQTSAFTIHIAAQAWLKLINWYLIINAASAAIIHI